MQTIITNINKIKKIPKTQFLQKKYFFNKIYISNIFVISIDFATLDIFGTWIFPHAIKKIIKF